MIHSPLQNDASTEAPDIAVPDLYSDGVQAVLTQSPRHALSCRSAPPAAILQMARFMAVLAEQWVECYVRVGRALGPIAAADPAATRLVHQVQDLAGQYWTKARLLPTVWAEAVPETRTVLERAVARAEPTGNDAQHAREQLAEFDGWMGRLERAGRKMRDVEDHVRAGSTNKGAAGAAGAQPKVDARPQSIRAVQDAVFEFERDENHCSAVFLFLMAGGCRCEGCCARRR